MVRQAGSSLSFVSLSVLRLAGVLAAAAILTPGVAAAQVGTTYRPLIVPPEYITQPAPVRVVNYPGNGCCVPGHNVSGHGHGAYYPIVNAGGCYSPSACCSPYAAPVSHNVVMPQPSLAPSLPPAYPSGVPVPSTPAAAVRPFPAGMYVGRGALGQPTVYVPGQPVRNLFRWVTP